MHAAMTAMTAYVEGLERLTSADHVWDYAARARAQGIPMAHELAADRAPVLSPRLVDQWLAHDPALATPLVANVIGRAATCPDALRHLVHVLCAALVPARPGTGRHAPSPRLAEAAAVALRPLARGGHLSEDQVQRLLGAATTDLSVGAAVPRGRALRILLDCGGLSAQQLEQLWSAWVSAPAVRLAIAAHPCAPQPAFWARATRTLPEAATLLAALEDVPDLVTRAVFRDWVLAVSSPAVDGVLVRAGARHLAAPVFRDYFTLMVARDPALAARALRQVRPEVSVDLEPTHLAALLTHGSRDVRQMGVQTLARVQARRTGRQGHVRRTTT